MSLVNTSFIITEHIDRNLIDFNRSVFYDTLTLIYPNMDTQVMFRIILFLFAFYIF